MIGLASSQITSGNVSKSRTAGTKREVCYGEMSYFLLSAGRFYVLCILLAQWSVSRSVVKRLGYAL